MLNVVFYLLVFLDVMVDNLQDTAIMALVGSTVIFLLLLGLVLLIDASYNYIERVKEKDTGFNPGVQAWLACRLARNFESRSNAESQLFIASAVGAVSSFVLYLYQPDWRYIGLAAICTANALRCKKYKDESDESAREWDNLAELTLQKCKS